MEVFLEEVFECETGEPAGGEPEVEADSCGRPSST